MGRKATGLRQLLLRQPGCRKYRAHRLCPRQSCPIRLCVWIGFRDVNIVKPRWWNSALPSILVILLCACEGVVPLEELDPSAGPPGTLPPDLPPPVVQSIPYEGIVIAGPVNGATVNVYTLAGQTILTTTTDANGRFSLVVEDDQSDDLFPLSLEAFGGVNTSTGRTPDFLLRSSVTRQQEVVSIDQFMTVADIAIRKLSAQSSPATQSRVYESVIDNLGFLVEGALPELQRSVHDCNDSLAPYLLSAEAVAESIRRLSQAAQTAGIDFSPDYLVEFLASDLSDGYIDSLHPFAGGQHPTIETSRLSAMMNVIRAQVFLELITNQFTIDGAHSAPIINNGLVAICPTASVDLASMTVPVSVIARATILIAVAANAAQSADIDNILGTLRSIVNNQTIAQLSSKLSSAGTASFANHLNAVLTGGQDLLDGINSAARGDVSNTASVSFAFSQSQYSFDEAGGQGTLTVLRTGDMQQSAGVVASSVSGGSASSGEDYFPLTRTLEFTPGQAAAEVSLQIIVDNVQEQTETIVVSLAQPSSGAELGNPSQTTVSIQDSSAPPPNTPPVISLLGANPLSMPLNGTYPEPGATASDAEDGNLSGSLQIDASQLRTDQVGTYQVHYSVSDSGGLTTSATRTVNVVDADVTAERPWEALTTRAQGFAKGVTGGAGGSVVVVTNLADSGPGSLRDALSQSGRTWIRFDVSGEISLSEKIRVLDDTTIDGRGANITIRGYGLRANARNVIVHNLKFTDIVDKQDAIDINHSSLRVWIDHVTFTGWGGDEQLAVWAGNPDKPGPSEITVSWCRFTGNNRSLLIGADIGNFAGRDISVTMHNNYFDGIEQRAPRLRYARVHSFNNYFRHWGGYASASSQDAKFLSENNVYEAAPGGSKIGISTGAYGSDTQSGRTRSEGDVSVNGAELREVMRESVNAPGYSYSMSEPDSAMINNVVSNSGWLDTPFPSN